MITIHEIWDTEPHYTLREVEVFLAGMKFSRTVAIETGKGLIASNAMTEKLQTMTMQKEVAKQKGRL